MKKMRYVLAFFIAYFATQAHAQQFGGAPMDFYLYNGSLGLYAQTYALHSRYQEAVGQARLDWARARYYDAVADGQYYVADMIEQFSIRLRQDMQILVRDQAKLRRKIAEIDRRAKQVEQFKMGRTNSGIFAGLNYFFMHVVPAEVLAATMSEKATPFEAKSFRANRKGVKAHLDFDGETVGDLFRFLEEADYSVLKFSPAHLLCLGALGKMSKAADDKIAELKGDMQKLRENALDIWTPPNLDAIRVPEVIVEENEDEVLF